MLSTDEVARRLGVKPATVYAYVSRGLLASKRNADGKGSLFVEAEVEAFATARRRTATPGDSPPIRTGLTLIKDGALYLRGQDVSALARECSFESVAMLLWTGELTPARLNPSAELLALAQAVTAPLPAAARLTDRLRVIVAAAAAADPLRFDTAPAAVIATGQTILATMVAALPQRLPPRPQARPQAEPCERFPLAAALWPRLTSAAATGAGIAVLNAALILLADHDIAASTLAARVAASTRAHPYAVVGAGLAALDGPLHGAASGLAYSLLADAARTGDPVGAISVRLRVGAAVPGFGHHLYPNGDPRATHLLALVREAVAAGVLPDAVSPGIAVSDAVSPGAAVSDAVSPRDVVSDAVSPGIVAGPAGDEPRRVGGATGREVRAVSPGASTAQATLAIIDEVAAAVTRRSGVAPNIDFAIAAFALLSGMDADAGEAIFAVARTAGWIAHALEEYGDRPSRFRPSGHYAGRPPTS